MAWVLKIYFSGKLVLPIRECLGAGGRGYPRKWPRRGAPLRPCGDWAGRPAPECRTARLKARRAARTNFAEAQNGAVAVRRGVQNNCAVLRRSAVAVRRAVRANAGIT